MQEKPQPKLPLTYVRTVVKPFNKIATYANVVMKDKDGKEWFFRASSFHFDLRPMEEEKGT